MENRDMNLIYEKKTGLKIDRPHSTILKGGESKYVEGKINVKQNVLLEINIC